jgi:hypothetical protein
MRNIVIKKTELATLALAYKWPSAKIAAHYGVEPKEIQSALVSFGLRKSKATPKDYSITLTDDLQITPSTNSLPSDATATSETTTAPAVEENVIF